MTVVMKSETTLFESAAQTDSLSHKTATNESRAVWLFSARTDLLVFAGSAALSLLALLAGAQLGVLNQDTPEWAWIPAVMLIDVAHVYSTGFRVYLNGDEFRRRPWLYALVPGLGLIAGIALYSEGALVFWRALAWLAVFHFVRQQYGWVALYRAKAGERAGRWIDALAIYAATLYPLLYWHTHLPRRFWWFLENDFTALPALFSELAAPVYWLLMFLYFARSAYRWLLRGEINPGKDLVVLTTAVCWYVGIITFNSDYAFTVTNVIIHGVPYLALIYWYCRRRLESANGRKLSPLFRHSFAHGPAVFLFILWALAFIEELFWDRSIWHERAWLFGAGWEVESWRVVIVPLLALPQLVHYVLDGFIWRRRSNPDFSL